MPVRAMRVVEKAAHEKSDQLYVYTFESPEVGRRQIVANLTNVYQPGDVVAVALEGTFLPGLEIVARKVFGVHSEGMALGRADAPLDADLTAEHDADRPVATYRVLLAVDVACRYPDEEAEKLARKGAAGGAGVVAGVEPSGDAA